MKMKRIGEKKEQAWTARPEQNAVFINRRGGLRTVADPAGYSSIAMTRRLRRIKLLYNK